MKKNLTQSCLWNRILINKASLMIKHSLKNKLEFFYMATPKADITSLKSSAAQKDLESK